MGYSPWGREEADRLSMHARVSTSSSWPSLTSGPQKVLKK